MSADIRQIRTAAETQLADTFAAARGHLPGADAVAALRDAAFAQFSAQGLPHRRVEAWKYTDLRALLREVRPLAVPPDAAAKSRARGAGRLLKDIDARRIVFVDGAFAPDLSDLDNLEPGLAIGSLATGLGAGDPIVARYLAQVLPTDDPALALNTALMGDGAVVHVADGVALQRPLYLQFVTVSEAPVSSYPRSLVVVGKGARLTLIEDYETATAGDHQVNAATELAVADEASVEHVRLVTGGSEALHISSLLATFGANVQYQGFTLTTGGAVVRNQSFVRFDGEGTHAGLRGASLERGRQHVDTTLVIDHAVGHCESRELYKSVLDDESRGVFQGKITVQPHAQKTDGKMMTQALLLSEQAEADAKPELEIFADDVVCGHGATAGALDDELKFYLMARGIPEPEAEALLIQAFVGEAVEPLSHEGLKEALMAAAVTWLQARSV